MPRQFNFTNTDEIVTRYLDAQEIRAVTTWQSARLDYQFEFHTMHEAGWPCYLREPDGPNRNLPKMNLKGRAWTNTVLQGSSVQDAACGRDFKAVIGANLEAFRTMAAAFYEGEEVGGPEALIWHARFTCERGRGGSTVSVRLPDRAQTSAIGGDTFWSNMQRLANTQGKPNCPTHRNSTCLNAGEAVQIPAGDAERIRYRYDDSFTVT